MTEMKYNQKEKIKLLAEVRLRQIDRAVFCEFDRIFGLGMNFKIIKEENDNGY